MDRDGRYVFRKLMANSVFTMSLNTQCVRWSIKLHLNKCHVLFFLRFSATWKGGTLEADFEANFVMCSQHSNVVICIHWIVT